MAILGVQILFDGEELAQRLAEHDPKFEPDIGVWLTRFEDSNAFDSVLDRQLVSMGDHSGISGSYVCVLVGGSVEVQSKMAARFGEATRRNIWAPTCTFIIGLESAVMIPAAGDSLNIVVARTAGAVPLSFTERCRMMANWLSFAVDLCRGTDGVAVWGEWFNKCAPAQEAGATERQATLMGFIERTTFQPQAVLRRLSEGLAADISRSLVDVEEAPIDGDVAQSLDFARVPVTQVSDFVTPLANAVALSVIGEDVESFEFENAEHNRVEAQERLPLELSRQMRVAVAMLQESQWSWREKFREAVDRQLERQSVAALPTLRTRLRNQLVHSASPPRQKSGSPIAPELPTLRRIDDCHREWRAAIETLEPVAAGLMAMTSWLALLCGFAFIVGVSALAGQLTPISSHPGVNAGGHSGGWLAGHAHSVGFDLGAAVAVVIVMATYYWRRHRAKRVALDLRADLDAAVDDWIEQTADAFRNMVQDAANCHVARARLFQIAYIEAELERLDCVAAALARNAEVLRNRAEAATDSLLPREFYQAARDTVQRTDILASLRGQLGTSTWRHRLDLMDIRTVLRRCSTLYGDFGQGLLLDKHPQLASSASEAIRVVASELYARLNRTLRTGIAGMWFLGQPTGTEDVSSVIHLATHIVTSESIYVAFVWSDQAGVE